MDIARSQTSRRIAEVRARYRPEEAALVHLRWSELVGWAELRSASELDEVLARLRAEIERYLGDRVVIVE